MGANGVFHVQVLDTQVSICLLHSRQFLSKHLHSIPSVPNVIKGYIHGEGFATLIVGVSYNAMSTSPSHEANKLISTSR